MIFHVSRYLFFPTFHTLFSGLAMLQGQYTTNYPQLMAGAVIAIIPMAVLFLVFQKQFVEGIATTGSKN